MRKVEGLLLVMFLILGVVLRFYKISSPIADWHSWRQADTAAVTRNYLKLGVNLFYPRYDDFSDVSGKGLFNPNGYRFVEFPVFNLIHLTLIKFFPGFTLEYLGRMVSVISATVTSLVLWVIVRRYAGNLAGVLTAGFYAILPYNVFFTRLVLPEPLMVCLTVVALLCFDNWISERGNFWLWFGMVIGTFAVLVKPMAVFLLIPFAWQLWHKFGKKIIYQKQLWVVWLIMVVPFLVWRTWEYRYPQGIPANAWLLNGNNIRFKGAWFQWIFGERIGKLILGMWGIFPLIEGLAQSGAYLFSWFGGALLYLTVFATGNVHHDYYQILIIPAISILLGVGVASIFKKTFFDMSNFIKTGLLVVSVAFMWAFSWYDVRGNYQINRYAIVLAGKAVDRLVPQDAIVIAPYDGDTAFLYQTNRRGFPILPLPIEEMFARFGAQYYVSVNYDDNTNHIINKYQVIEKTKDYVVVKL